MKKLKRMFSNKSDKARTKASAHHLTHTPPPDYPEFLLALDSPGDDAPIKEALSDPSIRELGIVLNGPLELALTDDPGLLDAFASSDVQHLHLAAQAGAGADADLPSGWWMLPPKFCQMLLDNASIKAVSIGPAKLPVALFRATEPTDLDMATVFSSLESLEDENKTGDLQALAGSLIGGLVALNDSIKSVKLDKRPLPIKHIRRSSHSYNLNSLALQPEAMIVVASLLSYDPSVVSITALGNYLGDHGATALAHLIIRGCWPKLSVLVLRGNQIGTPGATELLRATEISESLNEIDIEMNFGVSAELMTKIPKRLSSNASARAVRVINDGFSELCVCNVHFAVDDFERVVTALKNNPAVTSLQLVYSHIGDEGAKALATYLSTNTTLKILTLEGNGIGEVGTAEIAEALRGNSSLVELQIGQNGLGKALTQLADTLPTITNLVSFDLASMDSPSSQLLETLGSGVFSCAKLQNFRLVQYPKINNVEALVAGELKQSSSLLTMQLDSFGAIDSDSDDGFTSLRKSIAQCRDKLLHRVCANDPSLTAICLKGHTFDAKYLINLAKALTTNHTVTHLTINMSEFKEGSVIGRAWEDNIVAMHKLQYLDVHKVFYWQIMHRIAYKCTSLKAVIFGDTESVEQTDVVPIAKLRATNDDNDNIMPPHLENYLIGLTLEKAIVAVAVLAQTQRTWPIVCRLVDKCFDTNGVTLLGTMVHDKGAHPNVTAYLVRHDLLSANGQWWHYICEHATTDELMEVIELVLAEGNPLELSERQDSSGRRAVDLAVPRARTAIISKLFFLGRYEIEKGVPVHQSETSVVVFARDHKEEAVVALKLCRDRDHFERELSARSTVQLDDKYAVAVLSTYQGEEIELQAAKYGYNERPYCLVLDRADRNLLDAILHEGFAGKDMEQVKYITRQLASALEHLHEQGLVHGDLKPLNVVRVNGSWKLIDFDAAANFKATPAQFAAAKFSSAYCAPELVCQLEDGEFVVRSFERTTNIDELGYSLCAAHPSQDMFNLGNILYYLVTGRSLFHADTDDNIHDTDLEKLARWSTDDVETLLKCVRDRYLRNLLSRLLEPAPAKRLSASQVLNHFFLTGKKAERLPGEPPLHDVFISYRVKSDAALAARLYKCLTDKGLKVWFDQQSLEDGLPWEESFCKGLLSSKVFVPLLSPDGLERFATLEAESKCDNVLLEHRLALEGRELGLVERIFPLCIQEWPNTASFSDASVLEVEDKLRVHLETSGHGTPLLDSCMCVKEIAGELMAAQGHLMKSFEDEDLDVVCNKLLAIARPEAD